MKTAQEIQSILNDRDYIFMFMEEVEQMTAFRLWHKYISKCPLEKTEWEYHSKIFQTATFHAALLSVRKLNDFFTLGGRPDDIKADRFGFKNMEPPLDKGAQASINKYLAHMTSKGSGLRFESWNIDEYAGPIYLRAYEFCHHLEKDFLDQKMDAEILRDIASFKQGLFSHIKRVGVIKAKAKDLDLMPTKSK